MFFVFNKQKMYSYVIAAGTVIVLFILSFFFTNTELEVTEASTNIVNDMMNNKEFNNINNLILNK